MIKKVSTTPAFKNYRRAWKLFDLGVISKEELIDMLDNGKNPKNVKGNSYAN